MSYTISLLEDTKFGIYFEKMLSKDYKYYIKHRFNILFK